MMFDSLKNWFESLDEESKLFNHPDDEMLHSAMASVLYHVISADARIIGKEKHKFQAILSKEFDLNAEQVEHLYRAAKTSVSDLHSDLHTINEFLKPNPIVRMNFMQQLLELADTGGIHEEGLLVFYDALHDVFPEIKDLRDDESI